MGEQLELTDKQELAISAHVIKGILKDKETLRAKLEKAERVIEIALRLVPHPDTLQFTRIERELKSALEEYRGT